MTHLLPDDSPSSGITLFLGYARFRADKTEDAIAALEYLVDHDPTFCGSHPEVDYYLGRAYWADWDFDKAVRTLTRWFERRATRPGSRPIR